MRPVGDPNPDEDTLRKHAVAGVTHAPQRAPKEPWLCRLAASPDRNRPPLLPCAGVPIAPNTHGEGCLLPPPPNPLPSSSTFLDLLPSSNPAPPLRLPGDSDSPRSDDVGLAERPLCLCSSACCFFHHDGRPWNSPSAACVARSSGISCLKRQPCCVKAQVPSCTHLSQ